jgi:hypothetical protein
LQAQARCADLAASTPFREFKGNVSHSNYDVHVRPKHCGYAFQLTNGSHTGRENPADANSRALESVFEDVIAYKNRNIAPSGAAVRHVFRNVKLATTLWASRTRLANSVVALYVKVVDSLFVAKPRTSATFH